MSKQRFVLGAEQRRERVDKVLARLLPEVSRATVQRWIEEGRVQVDGKPCRAKDSVTAGSQIELEAGPPQLSEADPDPSVVLDVCYEGRPPACREQTCRPGRPSSARASERHTRERALGAPGFRPAQP